MRFDLAVGFVLRDLSVCFDVNMQGAIFTLKVELQCQSLQRRLVSCDVCSGVLRYASMYFVWTGWWLRIELGCCPL